jgi:hypothetical protein
VVNCAKFKYTVALSTWIKCSMRVGEDNGGVLTCGFRSVRHGRRGGCRVVASDCLAREISPSEKMARQGRTAQGGSDYPEFSRESAREVMTWYGDEWPRQRVAAAQAASLLSWGRRK